MKRDDIERAFARVQFEINDELNRFKEKLNQAVVDSKNSITISEIESDWRSLQLTTTKSYANLVSQVLSTLDTKGLIAAKKANSSRKGFV